MKALTLWQPWASLVACGAKRIETRPWQTAYRGPLAIHAAQRSPSAVYAAYVKPGSPLACILEDNGLELADLPVGCIVATCTLADIRRIESTVDYIDQYVLGDFTPGRYAWHLTDVQALAVPIPAKGKQGLWEWEGER